MFEQIVSLIKVAIIILLLSPVIMHYTRHRWEEWVLEIEPMETLVVLDDWLIEHSMGVLFGVYIFILFLFWTNKLRLGGSQMAS